MKFVALSRSFYEPSADEVATRLLGHWLVRQTAEGVCGGIIVETEAYLTDDPASHGFIGQTARNRVMYGPPGHTYVYFIYGSHCCVNAVCRAVGIAEAVLIRAVEPAFGEPLLHRNRPVTDPIALTSGPGKLCAAMKIDRSLDGADLCDTSSPLIIAENPHLKSFLAERGPIINDRRIGITRAAELPLRYYLDGSPFVSKRRKKQAPHK